MKGLRSFIFSLLLLTLASMLGACGGDSGKSNTNATTNTPTNTAENGTTTTVAQEVRVVMGEMYFKPAITTFKVGLPYKFVVVNEGSTDHEFTIVSPRKSGQNEKDLDKIALLDADKLEPGKTRTVDFTFKDPAPAGTLEIECSYPGHYEHGMHVGIVV